MNRLLKTMAFIFAALMSLQVYSAAQIDTIVVSSLSELKSNLDAENSYVKLKPGLYRVTPADKASGLFPDPVFFTIRGKNSVFDFSDVIIEFETDMFQLYGNVGVNEFNILGSNNIVKNLTMIDVGNTRPRRTALGILVEGVNNTLQGFHMTIRGSYPYGYGDLFGKGSGYVIKHFKHAAILIRGVNSNVLNNTVISRSYGHMIFCQGSINALIQGNYLEGEMRTTDDVLAEEGTGSPADEKDFMTVWGWKVPAGYSFSLQEDGIRAYNNGTLTTGETKSTRGMRVIDNTIVNIRSGVTIGFCDDEKYVDGCTAIGCEGGFWVGSGGQIVNSGGDAKHGSLYGTAYQKDKNNTVDLKLLPSEGAYGNRHILAYIAGSGQDITFRSFDPDIDPKLEIRVSGVKDEMRTMEINPTYNDFSSTGIKLKNYSYYPITLGAKSSGTTGKYGGEIIDKGTNNSFQKVDLQAITKFDQQIIFPTLPCSRITDSSFVACGPASSGLQPVFTSSDTAVALIVDGKIKIKGSGSCLITASQSGNEYFNPAPDVSRTLVVLGSTEVKQEQMIAFAELPSKNMGDADFAPTASASSGLDVQYSSSDISIATIVDGKIHVVGIGSCYIIASQAGDDVFYKAGDVQQKFYVKSEQTIDFPPFTEKNVGDPDFEPGAKASSGLTVTYLSNNPNVATIVNGKIHLVGVGSAAILASQEGNEGYNSVRAVQILKVNASGTYIEKAVLEDITVYPNPVEDQLIIKRQDGGASQLQIINAVGKIVVDTKCKGQELIIQMNELPGGMYFIKLKTKETDSVHRFIKK